MHLFETETEFNEERNNNYKEPWVSYTKPTSAVTYNKNWQEKLYDTPLTFEIVSAGTLIWKTSGSSSTSSSRKITYKINDGEWTDITSSYDGASIGTFNVGDKIQFKGDNMAYGNSSFYCNHFSGSSKFNAIGNIMSLINSTEFSNLKTFYANSAFLSIFENSNIVSAKYLILPATALTEACYSSMFSNCTSLVTAPELPATTLTIACYMSMFQGCTSLTTAPELPATTLVNNSYNSMFRGCTNLNYIKCLATTNIAGTNAYNWLYGVASSGTFVKSPNASSWSTGASGIPTNWTVQDAS